MKKLSFWAVFAASFLFLSIAVTTVSKSFAFSSAWTPLLIAFGLLIVSTVFATVFKSASKTTYIVAILNSIALGFSIRAWYIYRNLDNSFLTLILVELAALALLILFYAISFIPFVEKHYTVFFLILSAVVLALYILSLILFRSTYVSTFGYYSIFIWVLAICMRVNKEGDFYRKNVVISSFSIWIVATIVLLFILAGDGLDLDCVDISPSSKKNEDK